jgi:hypothetical protein
MEYLKKRTAISYRDCNRKYQPTGTAISYRDCNRTYQPTGTAISYRDCNRKYQTTGTAISYRDCNPEISTDRNRDFLSRLQPPYQPTGNSHEVAIKNRGSFLPLRAIFLIALCLIPLIAHASDASQSARI